MSDTLHTPTTRAAVTAALEATTPVPPPPLEVDTVDAIVALTARLFAISEDDLRTSRNRRPTSARQVALVVARANTSLSLTDLAGLFGQHHATAKQTIRRVTQTPALCAWAAAVNAELSADAGRVTA